MQQHQNQSEDQTASIIKKQKLEISRMVKLITLLVCMGMFLLYRFLYDSWLPSNKCIDDWVHNITADMNQIIYENSHVQYWSMLFGQLILDGQTILLMYYCVVHLKRFLLIGVIFCFYGLRTIFLQIEKFPYPDRITWQNTGFPSLVVPYGITRDFFYSGHTGFMIIALTFWSLKIETVIYKYITVIGTIYIVPLLIATRVHYSIDILSGALYAKFMFKLVKNNIILIDKMFTLLFKLFHLIYSKLKERINDQRNRK